MSGSPHYKLCVALMLTRVVVITGFLLWAVSADAIPPNSWKKKDGQSDKAQTVQSLLKKTDRGRQGKPSPWDLLRKTQNILGQDSAVEVGCWKSDLAPMSPGQKPTAYAAKTPGVLYYPVAETYLTKKAEGGKAADVSTPTPLAVGGLLSDYDKCQDHPTLGKVLYELYCLNVKKGPPFVPSGMVVSCPSGTACTDFSCAPGGICAWPFYGAACRPVSAASAGGDNGCVLGQQPFLDTDQNGTVDACVCPAGLYPADIDHDGNSDVCGPFKPIDGSPECAELLDPDWDNDGISNALDKDIDGDGVLNSSDGDGLSGVVQKAQGIENGGWTLFDYCAGPFALTHVTCAFNGVQSTTATQCAPTEICRLGNCVPSAGPVCQPTKVDLTPTGKGYVTVTPVDGSPTYTMTDKCYLLPEKAIDAVQNVYCNGPEGGAAYDGPTACPAGTTCFDGRCVAKKPPTPDDQDGDGIPNAKDPDKNGDGIPDAKQACVPEVAPTCSEPSDAVHPTDPLTGQLLYGDPHVFGVTELGVDITNCPGLPDLSLPDEDDRPDDCTWNDTELLPVLKQFGCEGNQPQSSVGPCYWTALEACDWLAGTPQERGLCKPGQVAQVTCVPASAATPGYCSGSNAFKRPVDQASHTDSCAPAQGPRAIKKWKVAANPAGVIAYYENCPSLQHCEKGVCAPDPCFAKNYNDQNACTEDTCDAGSGLPVYLPLNIDDNNFCTIDMCTTGPEGQAVITHTPITGGNCSGVAFCLAQPQDPTCQPKPGVDCGKLPKDASCPPDGTGGFDCAVCLDTNYAANHPECVQCATTLDYCFDDDIPNAPGFKGTAVIFPGVAGQEVMAHDECVDVNTETKQSTAVTQVACGPNNTFFYSAPYACPKGCMNGECVSADGE